MRSGAIEDRATPVDATPIDPVLAALGRIESIASGTAGEVQAAKRTIDDLVTEVLATRETVGQMSASLERIDRRVTLLELERRWIPIVVAVVSLVEATIALARAGHG